MEEKIIVVPSSLDLAKTLAYHNKALFNTRFLTPLNLAKEVLIRAGKICDRHFVSDEDKLVYYKRIIESSAYFKSDKLADIKKVINAIDLIRSLVTEDEENEIASRLQKGRFQAKNEALLDTYKQYMALLDKNNEIDAIGLIRKAVSSGYVFNSQLYYLKQYPLKPLDIKLLELCCENKAKEISLADLFDLKETDIRVEKYHNCYGSFNEAGMILTDIIRNKKADECIVACGDYNSYAQIFYDYALEYDIPLSFSNGLSVSNFYPGKLLKQYYEWSISDNFGWMSFFKMIYSPFFDLEKLNSLFEADTDLNEFYSVASRLRLSNDNQRNIETIERYEKAVKDEVLSDLIRQVNHTENLRILSKELSLPLEEFISRYALIRNNVEELKRFDEKACQLIVRELKNIKKAGIEIGEDVFESILKRKAGNEKCEPGHIFICPINKAMANLRKNLYLCGLSADIYPGSPSEDPLILDCDLDDFENESLTSRGIIRQKREDLFNLVYMASGLNNQINIFYSGLNVSELKHNNASSLLFELYKAQYGSDCQLSDFYDSLISTGYFDPKLSLSRKIGQAYNHLDNIKNKPKESSNSKHVPIRPERYSPSQLNTFFNCKKQYLFTYILKIPVEDEYNPYEVIDASKQGSLVHSLMEYLSEHDLSKEEFLETARRVFDEYMNICVPLIEDKIKDSREQFLEMLETGYELDKKYKRKVIYKEEDLETIHEESGIMIHGYPDRVELDENNKAVIIDFKTERDLSSHIKDDVDTCLQVLIYAYIVEKTLGYKVDHCEYRMLRGNVNNGIINCKFDKEIRNELSEKLKEFKNALETGDFDIEPFDAKEEKIRCKYCGYASICGKKIIDTAKDQ